MARVNPTRMNLIALRKNIEFAQKGKDLLERKRKVLVMEFMSMLHESRASRSQLNALLQAAYKTTVIASAFIGEFELEQDSMYVTEKSSISFAIRNIMGVRIPEIQGLFSTSESEKLQMSVAVGDVSESFDEVKKAIVDVAKREQGLKRLITEIDKVKRRVNALQYILVPSLQTDAKYIEAKLDAMDRDTFAALKHVKKKLLKASR
ncbi:MAG: V-type ATP synthase subunit D [Candidatus Micrarchaeia archaeon]